MNLFNEIDKLKAEGYSEANAQARLCQDIILRGIANSSLCRNVTIKGGVVMRSLSGSARRATQDVDIDFIRYSLDDASIDRFFEKIDNIPGLSIKRTSKIESLNHQDYKGKRVYVFVVDELGYRISSKVDIGVHADLELKQDMYCFDICFAEDGAYLLMNTPAQMITEKLKSLLRFGTRSTRYKDVFDIYYLSKLADTKTLITCVEKYIYADSTISINSSNEIGLRLSTIFESKVFVDRLEKSGKNWLELDVSTVLGEVLEYFKETL